MGLIAIIFIAMVATAVAAIVALVGHKCGHAVVWFGACLIAAICGVLFLQHWNRAILRVNQMAAVTQPANNTEELTALIRGMQQSQEARTYRDENLLPRLGEIIEALRHHGSDAFIQNPRMLLAWYKDDEPYVIGADLIVIHALGPRVDVERVEFLSPDRAVLGTAKNFQAGLWQKAGSASIVTTAFYVAPSTFHPFPTTHTAAVDDGKIEIMAVVKIPAAVDRASIFARVCLQEWRCLRRDPDIRRSGNAFRNNASDN
jgi:hypothetical protein